MVAGSGASDSGGFLESAIVRVNGGDAEWGRRRWDEKRFHRDVKILLFI